MTARNQLTQAEARKLFDYRDGTLFWSAKASGAGYVFTSRQARGLA